MLVEVCLSRGMRLTWLGIFTLVCTASLAGCPADDDGEGTGTEGSTETAGTDGSTTAPLTTGDPTATSTNGETEGATTTGIDPSTGTTAATDGSSTGAPTGSTGMATESSTGAAGFCDGEPIAGLDSAVAVPYGDLPPIGGGMTASTTGDNIPDDALWVRIGNIELTCEMPRGDTTCEEGVSKWWINMIIPPELQMPGEYSFEDLNVFIGSDDGTDCPEPGTSTSAGGGTPTGMVYIDEIGPEGIVGCIVSDDVLELDPNGSFQAQSCGQ